MAASRRSGSWLDAAAEINAAYPPPPDDPAILAAELRRLEALQAERRARCAHRWISDRGKVKRYCAECGQAETGMPAAVGMPGPKGHQE